MKINAIFLWIIVLAACNPGYSQKDPFDSFDNIDKIGLVVQDTSSLDATFEQPIYDALTEAGHIVVKIDTTTMDQATYDASGLNWSSLKVAIISFGTDSAAVDTSISLGVGEVPLIVMEPYYWSNFFANDSTGSTISDDSLRVHDADFVSDLFGTFTDTVLMFSSNTTLYTSDNVGSLDRNLFRLQNGVDNVITMDSLNNVLRSEWGAPDATDWSDNQLEGWSLFNRLISRLTGAYLDTLFTIGLSVATEGQPGTEGIPIKNHIEANGHIMYFVDSDSALGIDAVTGVDWGDLDGFIARFFLDEDSVTAAISSVISLGSVNFADSLGLNSGGSSLSQDSLRIINNTASLTQIYSLPDTIKILTSNEVLESILISSNAIGLGEVFNLVSGHGLVIHRAQRYAYLSMPNPSNYATDGWTVLNRTLGWIFEPKPFPPSGFTLTTLSTDSIDADWTDNSSSEDGYSLFIYEPDSAYFSHLAASTISDTLFPFWPPNSRVIADVAVISGTDTVFSSSGRDTAWTFAAVPPPVFTKNLTDTSMSFVLNGFLIDDRFDDQNFTVDPVWTVQTGGIEIDSLRRRIRTTDASVPTVFSTPFVDVSGDSINDGEWFVSYQFSDSSSFDQGIRFYPIAHKASLTDSSGYYIVITESGLSIFVQATTTGSIGSSEIAATGVSAQEKFKWHTIRIVRDFEGSPQDSTIIFTVYVDGDSLLSMQDSTWTTSQFIGVRLDSSDINVDNFQFRQTTPSGNSATTLFAVQDSVSGLFVSDAGDSLQVTEDWRSFSDWGSAIGDSVGTGTVGLKADSSYTFRSKARSGQ